MSRELKIKTTQIFSWHYKKRNRTPIENSHIMPYKKLSKLPIYKPMLLIALANLNW
jgi:hypothetical protein